MRTREPTYTVDRGGAIADAGIVLKAPEDSLNENRLVEFWDAHRGELIGQQPVPGYVRCTALTPEGTLAAVGYAHALAGGYGGYAGGYYNGSSLVYRESYGSLNSWDFASGEHTVLMWDIKGVREGASVGMAFSPNMRFFVASEARYKGAVFVYDIAQRKHRLTIRISNTLGNRVAIAPDNRTLATACVAGRSPTEFDEAVYLWDLVTGEQIKKVGVPDAAVTAISFSSDGKRLVTATEMGTALVWPVD